MLDKYSDIKKSILNNFSRFEFKYILNNQIRDEFENNIKNFLYNDPFVYQLKDQKYSVRSLYFDDQVYSAFHDKIDGIHTRHKFRLRSYSHNYEEKLNIFLEKKGRYNNLVYKNRYNLNDKSILCLKGNLLSKKITCQSNTDLITEFTYDYYKKRIKPIVLIDYHRRPYFSKYDPTFRITFDDNLRAMKSDQLYPKDHIHFKKILPGYTVVEIKFSNHIPSWFHKSIQYFQLKRLSISKICAGIEILELQSDENG